MAKDPGDRFQTAGELAEALSLAAELRPDLPLPHREFLRGLRLPAGSSALGVLLGFGGLMILGPALDAGAFGTAAAAAGLVSLVLAAPVVRALLAARRLLKKGYDRSDMMHALSEDLGRQKQELAVARYLAPDRVARVARKVAVVSLGLFALGTAAALLGINLPERVFIASVSLGAMTGALAGGVLLVRERARNRLTGQRWLRFWSSRAGEWAARLAAFSLRPARGDALPAPPQPVAESEALPEGEREKLLDVVHQTESCVMRGRAWLEASSAGGSLQAQDSERRLLENLELLEAVLARFRSLDAAGADVESLRVDIQAAREGFNAVDALIGGGEWAP